MSAPKVLRSAEPSPSEAARQLRYSGKTLINCVISEQGKIVTMQVIHAAGLGLDEQAMGALLDYQFEAAKENGRPVRVEVNMEINFQLR